MKEELQGLLLQAKQMEAEQKAKLTPIERSEDFEYEIGLLSGIKRIVLLIERHIERITDSQEYVIERVFRVYCKGEVSKITVAV